jgi:hypothetical protein
VSPTNGNLYCWYSSAWTKVERIACYHYENPLIIDQQEYSVDSFSDYFCGIWFTSAGAGYKRTVKGFSTNLLGTVIQMNDGTATKDYMITSFDRDYMNKEETYSLAEVA